MKNWKLLLYSAILVLFISSCQNVDNEKKQDFEIELRNIGLENIAEQYAQFWDASLNDIGLDVICSCECDDLKLKTTMLDKYSNLLPEFNASNSNLFNVGCDTLKEMIGTHCFYTPEEYHNFVIFRINSTSTESFPLSISYSEKELLVDMLNDIKSNPSMDFSLYEQRWENLDVSTNNNVTSLAIIALASSLQNYLFTHNVFPEDDTPQAFVWKAASIIGGFYGTMLVDGLWDVATDGDLTADEMLEDAIKGAVVGALM